MHMQWSDAGNTLKNAIGDTATTVQELLSGRTNAAGDYKTTILEYAQVAVSTAQGAVSAAGNSTTLGLSLKTAVNSANSALSAAQNLTPTALGYSASESLLQTTSNSCHSHLPRTCSVQPPESAWPYPLLLSS